MCVIGLLLFCLFFISNCVNYINNLWLFVYKHAPACFHEGYVIFINMKEFSDTVSDTDLSVKINLLSPLLINKQDIFFLIGWVWCVLGGFVVFYECLFCFMNTYICKQDT